MKMLANMHEFGVSDKELAKKEKGRLEPPCTFLTASVNVVSLVAY
jgi:hypothetical protein